MGRSRETPGGPEAFVCQLLEPRPYHVQGFSRLFLTCYTLSHIIILYFGIYWFDLLKFTRIYIAEKDNWSL